MVEIRNGRIYVGRPANQPAHVPESSIRPAPGYRADSLDDLAAAIVPYAEKPDGRDPGGGIQM